MKTRPKTTEANPSRMYHVHFNVHPRTFLSKFNILNLTTQIIVKSSYSNLPSSSLTMQAVVFKGPLEVALEERPKPQIQEPTDAILKVRYTALCGR